MGLDHLASSVDDVGAWESELFDHVSGVFVGSSWNSKNLICETSEEGVSTSWGGGHKDGILVVSDGGGWIQEFELEWLNLAGWLGEEVASPVSEFDVLEGWSLPVEILGGKHGHLLLVLSSAQLDLETLVGLVSEDSSLIDVVVDVHHSVLGDAPDDLNLISSTINLKWFSWSERSIILEEVIKISLVVDIIELSSLGGSGGWVAAHALSSCALISSSAHSLATSAASSSLHLVLVSASALSSHTLSSTLSSTSTHSLAHTLATASSHSLAHTLAASSLTSTHTLASSSLAHAHSLAASSLTATHSLAAAHSLASASAHALALTATAASEVLALVVEVALALVEVALALVEVALTLVAIATIGLVLLVESLVHALAASASLTSSSSSAAAAAHTTSSSLVSSLVETLILLVAVSRSSGLATEVTVLLVILIPV